MKSEHQKVLTFSVIAVLILFQAAVAHSYYDSLVEADFLGIGLKFEAADVDTLYVDKQVSADLGTGPSSACFFPGSDSPEPFSLQNSTFSSSMQVISVLRC